MIAKKAEFKYRPMEKSIKSLHESISLDCSELKKIYPQPLGKKKNLLKKNR